MLNKIRKAALALLAAALLATLLSMQPVSVRADGDPTPTPTPPYGGNMPETCGSGC